MFARDGRLLGWLVSLVVFSAVPAAAGGTYLVQAGDTLTGISRMFGVDLNRMRELNRLVDAAIKPGDRIRIPDALPGPKPIVTVRKHPDASADQIAPALPAKPDPIVEGSPSREVGSDPVPLAGILQRRELSSERVLQALCRTETVYHSIVKGDTLYSLAIRYATELDSLLQINGLRKNSRLSIGQKIVIRKNAPRAHTVARRETLSSIASRYGIQADAIALLNRLDSDKITAGQLLLIEPCDPYAAAGSAPPPLAGRESAEMGGAGATTADSAATVSQQVIELAKTMLNVPYRFGGSTLRGIDCSAYVQRVFRVMDLQIPRTARGQYTVGTRIGWDDIQTGDLVFFRTYASFPSHVGIYLGENLFIHASSMARRVTIDSMDRPYYRKRFIGARRLVDDVTPAVASAP